MGKQQHNHNGQVGDEVAAKIISRVRKEAEVEYFKPASDGVLTVGTIRKWRQDAETASQGLFFDCWAKRRVNFH